MGRKAIKRSAGVSNKPPFHTSRVLTLNAAADWLGVSRRTLEGVIATGALATVQVSRRRIGVAETDLVAYVAARRSVAGQSKGGRS